MHHVTTTTSKPASITLPALERAGWPVNEWAYVAGISRASTYELLAAGRLASVKFGGKRLITTPPREFLASLAA